MRICCVGYVNGEGGAQRQMIMLANALADRENKVHLLVMVGNDIRYKISDKVILHDLTFAEQDAIHPILGRYKAIKKMYEEIVPEVSIHYNLQSVYLSAMMKKSITGQIIYSERGDPGDSEYAGLLGLVRTLAFQRVAGFVFQTKVARDYFNEKIRRRSIVIHNSVMLNCSYDLTQSVEREKRIVGVGRLHEQKNFPLLINAYSLIAEKFPDYVLEIYGEGKQRNELEELIASKNLQDRVLLKGARKDVHDCIYNASLFVLSSDYEGMPNALMEAMALGLPCISTDWRPGAACELIQDGKNGFVVPISDANCLAQRMSFMLEHKEETEIMGRNAQEIRITHTHKVVFNMWDEFLKEVVAKNEKTCN